MYHKFSILVVCVLAALLLGTCSANGSLVGYLKVGEIEGDVQTAGHVGWSDILTYEMSFQNYGWYSPGGSSKVSLSEMYITKLTDKASPLLLNSVWNGELFENAQIDVVQLSGSPQIYLQWILQDVVVSGYSTLFDGESVELVALDFGSMTYIYHPPGGGEPIEVFFDREGEPPAIVGSIPEDFEFLLQFEATPAPEPTVWLLTGLATLALAAFRGVRSVMCN